MKRPNANTVIAVAALVTSVVAVLVAWDESRMLRKSQRASFMPILEVFTTVSTAADDLRVELAVRNTGHGVARIETAQITAYGDAVESYEMLVDRVFGVELARQADFSWSSVTGFQPAGDTVGVLRFNWEDTAANRQALRRLMEREVAATGDALILSLCYCSVFDECWKADDRSGPPIPVSRCKPTRSPVSTVWQTYGSRDPIEQ
jgi:hypothetical protein